MMNSSQRPYQGHSPGGVSALGDPASAQRPPALGESATHVIDESPTILLSRPSTSENHIAGNGRVPGQSADSPCADPLRSDLSQEPPAGLLGSPFDDNSTVAIHRPAPISPADANTRPWHRPGTGPIILPSHNVNHRWRKIFKRFISKSWGDGLFGMSAEAAFWQALSTAPLLLALLGSIGFVGGWFGPDTINEVEQRIVAVLRTVFSPEVAGTLIEPTVDSILHRGQADVVSVGFVIALWAGSSAIASFVESITIAYNQHEVRHPVAERFFALGVYLLALIFGIFALPLLAVGPEYLPNFFPDAWGAQVVNIVDIAYYPGIGLLLVLALTLLYKVAPRHKHPWRRGIPGAVLAATVFIVSSFGLRIYITYVTTHGLTYGALATPIAFLLFAYFVGIAIILGAQFNNATLEFYPPKTSKRERRKWQRLEQEKSVVDGSAIAPQYRDGPYQELPQSPEPGARS